MQASLRKTDIRQTREQITGTAEGKRLDILAQCNVKAGRCRKDMSGSKINEAIGDLIGTGELELLSFGKGGRCCRTTAKGIASLKAKRTELCDTVFVRNEDNTNASRNDPLQFGELNLKAQPLAKKAFGNEYELLEKSHVERLIKSLKPKVKK